MCISQINGIYQLFYFKVFYFKQLCQHAVITFLVAMLQIHSRTSLSDLSSLYSGSTAPPISKLTLTTMQYHANVTWQECPYQDDMVAIRAVSVYIAAALQ